jgi:hypothetical protein
MNRTFREKSLWLVLVGLAVVYGSYFIWVLPSSGPSVRPEQVAGFVAAVVVLVIVQVVGHTVLAILDRRTDPDERDREITLRGARNGSLVLATGVFAALCVSLVAQGNFLFTHILLAFWVMAELVDAGSQLVLYRRWG